MKIGNYVCIKNRWNSDMYGIVASVSDTACVVIILSKNGFEEVPSYAESYEKKYYEQDNIVLIDRKPALKKVKLNKLRELHQQIKSRAGYNTRGAKLPHMTFKELREIFK